jgi:hypothetical protein
MSKYLCSPLSTSVTHCRQQNTKWWILKRLIWDQGRGLSHFSISTSYRYTRGFAFLEDIKLTDCRSVRKLPLHTKKTHALLKKNMEADEADSTQRMWIDLVANLGQYPDAIETVDTIAFLSE